MNLRTSNVLEYEKIIAKLRSQEGSEMTKAVISDLEPFDDPRLVRDALMETDEAARLIVFKGPLPIGAFYDIGDSLVYARKGGVLTCAQLLRVRYNMKTAADIRAFLSSGDLPDLPVLSSMAEMLDIIKELEEDIARCILSDDEVADAASMELRNIRRAIIRQNDALKSRLERMVAGQGTSDVLQDNIVTIRDGRYVLPVKAEQRSKFPGIVHDQSGSGATLFIEPQVIVEMNNRLKELAAEEQAEIERILTELTERVAEHYDGLRNNQEMLVRLDLINAKGKLSAMMQAESPKIDEGGVLDLKEARHPLIDPRKVVPLNVKVGEEYTELIITGPNTGGKTVTLKTCGLLAMMAQTGLHVPASANSRIPVYRDIFADIGDEQSIEQSLSTFSSHMNNIVDILHDAGPDTLVLIDELGAGTDPTEGAALAISILENLAEKGATVLATTHYNELKKYALSADGVQNASMEFDVETLSPTYHLTIGTPGSSNAFEISSKLGLDATLIERARQLMEGRELEFQEILTTIEKDRREAEDKLMEADRMLAEAKERQEELKKEIEKTEREKERIVNEAKEEARDILSDVEEVSKEVREELKQLSKMESLGQRNKKFSESRRKIKDAAGRYRETFIKETNDRPVNIKDVKPGDRVKVLSLNQNGEVIGPPTDKGVIPVQVGAMKIRAEVDDLKLIADGRRKKKKPAVPKGKGSYGAMYRDKALNVSRKIDVRGQNLDEAEANVAKYLDDAFMAGIREVTIVHGKGTGVLQAGLRKMLKTNKYVEGFRRGGYNEGGDGATIVSVKEH